MTHTSPQIWPSSDSIQVGLSAHLDPDKAIEEIAQQFEDSDPSFILLFVPDGLDFASISAGIDRHLQNIAVFGCTSAGQITPNGYENGVLLAVSFPRQHFRFASQKFSSTAPLSIENIATEAKHLAKRFSHTAGWNRLALVLSDGLSKQEDLIVAALETGLENIPIFGGSAADGLAFDKTYILHQGEFCPDSTLLLLLETDLAFRGVGFDHFEPTENRMVVTKANPAKRMVLEINGSPAGNEYARFVGLPTGDLAPLVFAENPVLVKSGKTYHVRAIQQIHDDGALSFLSAIDDGLVLTLGRGTEIIETLEKGLKVSNEFGHRPILILGFDCFLRRLEIEHKQCGHQASEIFKRHRVVGFNTYGEQHLGVHVNQTFVGVAFFAPTGGNTI